MSISPELFDIVVLPSVFKIFKSVPSCSIVASDPAPRIIFDVSVKVMSSPADTIISLPPVTCPATRIQLYLYHQLFVLQQVFQLKFLY